MFSMISKLGRGPQKIHLPKTQWKSKCFNDFRDLGRAPIISGNKKNLGIRMLSSIWEAEKEPSSAHTHPKNYGNLYVLNDVSGWAAAQMTPHHPAPPQKNIETKCFQ